LEIDPNPKYASAVTRLLERVTKYNAVKKQKRNEPEAKHIEKEIQKDVDDTTDKAKKEVEAANRLAKEGQDLNDLGKYNEALTVIDKALEIDPNNVTALNIAGFPCLLELWDQSTGQMSHPD
jgi:tetratricopeptide (TPR) repeat protein